MKLTVRTRLTAAYAVLFCLSTGLVLLLSWVLLDRHLERTLPRPLADETASDLGGLYVLAFAGALVLAVTAGWVLAGQVLAPLERITRTARRVSDERLNERIALEGPADELRELADTFDAMLDDLAEAFDAQRRFVANASHELRRPLTVIRSEVEVTLADPEASREELREMGEVVIASSLRTEALLEGLMALARSQRGLLRRTTVDLAPAARSAVAMAAEEARAADVRVRIDPEPAEADGDRRLIERLVANLVENAVRHNHPGGTVDVVTESRNGGAVVRVENTGAAMDPAVVQRLTQPFERGGRTGETVGAGLGLSIVSAVAEAHGGELRLEAREGGGLRAEVSLPAERRPA